MDLRRAGGRSIGSGDLTKGFGGERNEIGVTNVGSDNSDVLCCDVACRKLSETVGRD
jgi:hypothetical protein